MCDYHMFEPETGKFWLEVFVEQFVVAEVKCKMSAISPVRQQELLQTQHCEDALDYFCYD